MLPLCGTFGGEGLDVGHFASHVCLMKHLDNLEKGRDASRKRGQRLHGQVNKQIEHLANIVTRTGNAPKAFSTVPFMRELALCILHEERDLLELRRLANVYGKPIGERDASSMTLSDCIQLADSGFEQVPHDSLARTPEEIVAINAEKFWEQDS